MHRACGDRVFTACDSCYHFSCRFAPRHNSATEQEVQEMVNLTGFGSMAELIDATVPKAIRRGQMDLGEYTKGYTESEFIAKFK